MCSHRRHRPAQYLWSRNTTRDQQLSENARLLGIQVLGNNKAVLVIINLDISRDEARSNPTGTNDDDALLRSHFERIEGLLRCVPIADTGQHNTFCAVTPLAISS